MSHNAPRAAALRAGARPGAQHAPAVEHAPDAPTASHVPDDTSDATDELHRRAVELREIRMGLRAQSASPKAQVTAAGTVSMTFPVAGMTCRSCEVRINRFVGRLPGVEAVKASAVKGSVTVECSAPVAASAIEKAINQAGYALGRTPWLASDAAVWATAGVGVLLVAALGIAAGTTGVADLASRAGDIAQGGLVVALLLGLAAGVSTCMALVGGLLLGLSAAFQAGRPSSGGAAAMRPSLVFVGGRIAGYAGFGGVLGAVGASVAMPPQLTAVLMVVVAAVMLLLGARLTGLSPRLAGWSPTLPMALGRRLGLAGEEGAPSAYSDARTAVLGAASFFLPCGFTQAIQIFALSTGSPLYGAALLGTFAIGTAPGLLTLAGLPLVVPARAKPTLLRLVGVVVIGFGLLNGSAGFRLSGITLPSFAAAAKVDANLLGADGVERLTTYQDADGYSPSNVTIYAGYPVEWTVVSKTTNTCAALIYAPSVKVSAQLQQGPNTFRLPPLDPGVLHYSCAMGMYAAQITVLPKPATAPAASAQAVVP